jgi:hypothetical protein
MARLYKKLLLILIAAAIVPCLVLSAAYADDLNGNVATTDAGVQITAGTEGYWTAARMAKARPFPLLTLDASLGRFHC